MSRRGRVIKDYCGYYLVECSLQIFRCRCRGNLSLSVVTGDEVVFHEMNSEEGRIEAVVERRVLLAKPPVANVDLVLLINTFVEPAFDSLVLDRHLASIDIPLWIVHTKADLGVDRTWIELYAALGYPCFTVSAQNGSGLAELKGALQGKTAVLVGQSGVGKSMLVNALAGAWLQRVNALSLKIKRGRQTTRFVELFNVGPDTYVADAPGFTYGHLPQCAEDLQMIFPELRQRFGQCRFNNCLHRDEPDCIIRNAVTQGVLAPSRYQSYLVLLKDVEKHARQHR